MRNGHSGKTVRPRFVVQIDARLAATGITELVIDDKCATGRIEIDDKESVAFAISARIHDYSPICAIYRHPMRPLVVAECDPRRFAGMLRIGNIQSYELVRVCYRLKPIVASSDRHAAVLPFECPDESRGWFSLVNTSNEIQLPRAASRNR